MPANLPPAYHDAESRYRAATSVADKIEALEEMLRVMPKHKGTDKLQADVRARISKLRRQPVKSGATRHATHRIEREGAAQIALVGPPNAGKSALVERLTHARPVVAEYPFATREPVPGMMRFEDVAFQLVDLPPLCEEHVEPWVYDLIRHADLLWLVVEHEGSIDELQLVLGLLRDKRIVAYPAGTEPPPPEAPAALARPALLVVTGADRPDAGENVRILRELLDVSWPLVATSSADGTGLDELSRASFAAARLVRVYTKQPGKPADRDTPFTLPRGSTVEDLARTIHKELVEQFGFARLWGARVHDGQTVQRDHVLEDGDVIELHRR